MMAWETDLMDVQVYDQDLPDSPSLQQHLARDGEVIQDAETGTKRWEGMMGPAGCVACKTMLQGKLCSQQRTYAPTGLLQLDRMGLQ